MNDRIIALVAFLGVFMWLWSTEHENRAARAIQRAEMAARPPVAQPVSHVRPRSVSNTVEVQMPIVDTDGGAAPVACVDEAVQIDSTIPLPDGIAPGRYVVLDCQGRSRQIEVTPEQLCCEDFQCPLPPRDFYVKVVDGRHWIFENVEAIEAAGMGVAASVSTPVVRDEVAYPTGACIERTATAPAQDAGPQVEPSQVSAAQWREWLNEVRSQFGRYWERRRIRLAGPESAPLGTAESLAGQARQTFRLIRTRAQTVGQQWWNAVLTGTGADEIALPPGDDRPL